jgi:predicted glycogen debranching enzyme
MHELLAFEWPDGADAASLANREWLVTNGLGGYASGTVLGIPMRRYHGLFVPNLAAPRGRHLMIGRYDEELDCGGAHVLLGGAESAAGNLESDAPAAIRAFSLDGRVPMWRFAVGPSLIERSIVMPHGRNTVCVHYRLLDGPPVRLRLRPYAVMRRVDTPLVTLSESPFRLSVAQGRYEVDLPGMPLGMRLAVSPADATFVAQERASATALYREERARGYEHVETSFSPGYFAVHLATAPVTFVATTEEHDAGMAAPDGEAMLGAERARAERLLAAAGEERDRFARELVLAADQFLILPASRGAEPAEAPPSEEQRTVVAGYHWFGDWGRDTMISLEGLTLCTGRHREAAAILRTFARYVRDGLLPNVFPEGAREARYNTMDATLWYFHAIDRYTRCTGDRGLVAELHPTLVSILEHHVAGTRFGIGVDPADGLLRGGADGLALTWMDAKFDDWVVTPRRGKPVEIQALWYNALVLMAEWTEALARPAQRYRDWAVRVQSAFNRRYWNPSRGCLLDVVDGPEGDDSSLRPNQVFALSLAWPVLDRSRWPAVLECVATRLLTPFGLRTLASDHPDYCRDYHGDLRTRDAAYHQGTVWPWLLGHFVDAWLRAGGERAIVRALLAQFPAHLREAGVGSVSEIFDAESPYRPRGCIAQAWSVAEILRAWQATAPEAPRE